MEKQDYCDRTKNWLKYMGFSNLSAVGLRLDELKAENQKLKARVNALRWETDSLRQSIPENHEMGQ